MHAAQFTVQHPAPRTFAVGFGAPDAHARLNWLLAYEAEAERRALRFRTPREEEEMLLMRRPVTTERAFARFGLLLGTLPPAAIFLRLNYLFLSKPSDDSFARLFLALSAGMLLVCALFGRFMGGALGRSLLAEARRRSWAGALLVSLLTALAWGSAVGAAGGALFFGVGSFFGVLCALACAVPAFLVFTPLHRALARGGMIDARHLRPLVWGVPATLAALILSPYLLPY